MNRNLTRIHKHLFIRRGMGWPRKNEAKLKASRRYSWSARKEYLNRWGQRDKR